MRIQQVSLEAVLVNRANDRHGELSNEEAGIEWLLSHRSGHMQQLTRDIVAVGKIFEPPLVHKLEDKFIVYDGNRRVTCLKLLAEPQKAPTADWAKFFTDQRAKWKGAFPKRIPCRVETNLDEIDEILYRRHTGTRSGVGQSQWDDQAKSNFVRRTGKRARANLAEEIEKALNAAGLLPKTLKIPRSNLNRLLSAEALRNRVGISLQKKKLRFTHNPEKALSSLLRIVQDLASKTVTLDDIWDFESKREYLNLLEKEGVLPTIEDVLDTHAGEDTTEPEGEDGSSSEDDSENAEDSSQESEESSEGKSRTTLIRNIDYGVIPHAQNQRAMDIWGELKFRLHFGEHDNAIAVLFRVLIELAIENYVNRHKVGEVHPNDKLSVRYKKVLDHMSEASVFPAKQIKDLRKFQKSEALFSSNTFNSYVHHSSFFPSDHHLKSMWDNIAPFVVQCLKAE